MGGSVGTVKNNCFWKGCSLQERTHRSRLITRIDPIITMTNNGMMRFVKSLFFGIASFPLRAFVHQTPTPDQTPLGKFVVRPR